MNVKGNYEKGNRIEIIKALYVNGCLPYRCLGLLSGEIRLVQRKVLKMQKEGLVEIKKTKYGKCIYLSKEESKKEEYKAYIPDSYMKEYEENKEKVRKANYKDSRMERLQKNAEISLLMHISKIATYPDELLREWIPGKKLPAKAIIYLERSKVNNGEGYHVRIETKDSGKKVIGSRLSGIMISPGGNYAVYNITNHLIEWERAGEVKMAGYLERYIRNVRNIEEDYYNEEKEKDEKNTDIECIIFANKIELFYRVIINENQIYMKRKKRQPLINIDYAYKIMYSLPTDKNGITMLNIMKQKKWKQQMWEVLISGYDKDVKDYSIECDGYNEEDGYVLLYCDCDIAKLKLFIKRGINKREGERFTILCFTFQIPLLEQFDLTGISVKAIELEKYAEMIGIEVFK